jgi:hypothetical protein
MFDVVDDAGHLAAENDNDEEHQRITTAMPSPSLTTAQARSLYASHALSTWNARSYEFAAVSHTTQALR